MMKSDQNRLEVKNSENSDSDETDYDTEVKNSDETDYDTAVHSFHHLFLDQNCFCLYLY